MTDMNYNIFLCISDKSGVEKKLSCKLDDAFFQNGPGRFGASEILTTINIPLTSKVSKKIWLSIQSYKLKISTGTL